MGYAFSGGLHQGVLHNKQFINGIDPMVPSVPTGFDNIGVHIDDGKISDTGKRRMEKLFVSVTGQILDVSTDSHGIYWALGGVKEWFVNIKFTRNQGALGSIDSLYLTLPDTTQINSVFNDYYFPVEVKSASGVFETVYGHFQADNNRIYIPNPSYGWSANSQDNIVNFSLRWF